MDRYLTEGEILDMAAENGCMRASQIGIPYWNASGDGGR